MEVDPAPVTSPPPADDSATEAAKARAVGTRLFVVLALLVVAAGVAGYPYMRAFAEQGVGTGTLARLPAAAAIPILALSQLVLALPCLVIGLRLGPQLGLDAPLLRAWLARVPPARPARATLRLATLVGLALGAFITAVDALPLGLEERILRAGRAVPEHPPVWAGVLGSLSAGVTEEVLVRFGLFTLVAWLVAQLVRAPAPAAAPPVAFHAANGVAALTFGALHFGNASAIGLPLDAVTVAFILGINGLVGLACGWLYWKRGLEAAMAAHVATDLVIHALVPALAPGP